MLKDLVLQNRTILIWRMWARWWSLSFRDLEDEREEISTRDLFGKDWVGRFISLASFQELRMICILLRNNCFQFKNKCLSLTFSFQTNTVERSWHWCWWTRPMPPLHTWMEGLTQTELAFTPFAWSCWVCVNCTWPLWKTHCAREVVDTVWVTVISLRNLFLEIFLNESFTGPNCLSLSSTR